MIFLGHLKNFLFDDEIGFQKKLQFYCKTLVIESHESQHLHKIFSTLYLSEQKWNTSNKILINWTKKLSTFNDVTLLSYNEWIRGIEEHFLIASKYFYFCYKHITGMNYDYKLDKVCFIAYHLWAYVL